MPPSPEAAVVREGSSLRGVVGTWAALVALVAGLVLTVEWADAPPAPRGLETPPLEFSEARARPVVEHLAGTVGRRVAGTTDADRAAEYLADTLRRLPGVEVELQTARDTWAPPYNRSLVAYQVTNVLARLPGELPSTILVSSHYDSAPEGRGAADDGAAVAVMVETLRALSQGPRPRHTLLFNFNGAEELGLYGAAGFLEHPVSRDVVAFVNLEAAGAGGKAILFQAAPGHEWLVETYAREVPHPYGNVLGQDIFQSGVLPSDTDFRVYRDEGKLGGLDIALFQDGYAYHTALDRVERLEPGSMQHMGDNLLALVRGLAGSELPRGSTGEGLVYYDVLGHFMVVQRAGVARLWTVAALLGVVGALGYALRRGALSVRALAAGFGVTLVGLVAGLLAALLASLSLHYVLGRPHGWFATPWLGALAFGASALAGALAVHAPWAARSRSGAEERSLATWGGALLLSALSLAGMTWAGLGAAYLFLWWALPGALGLGLSVRFPRAFPGALVLSCLPGALLLLQVSSLVLKLFVPVTGQLALELPLDPLVALLVALPVGLGGGFALVAAHRVGRLGPVTGVWGAVALVLLAATAWRFPYQPERPKRLMVEHLERDGRATLVFRDEDFLPLAEAVREVPDVVPASDALGMYPGQELFTAPAERVALPAFQARTVSSEYDAGSDTRAVVLHLTPLPDTQAELRIPREALVGWSPSPTLPVLRERDAVFRLGLFDTPPEGRQVRLVLRGREPVEAELREFLHQTTPALESARAALPPWTTAYLFITRIHRLAL